MIDRAIPAAVGAGVLDAIGRTPLVGLRRLLDRDDVAVWAKLEAANPGGSAKDRPAAQMIADGLAAGLIGPDTTVVESSSGNMGVGLAQACRFHGVRFVCVTDVRTDSDKVAIMRALGARVEVIEEPHHGDLLTARLQRVADLVASTPDAFWPDQYANGSNARAHANGTMREIDEALGGVFDRVYVATSTGGTLHGCLDYLRERDHRAQVIAVDAVGSALFGGRRAPRRLPGFGAGMETKLSRECMPDQVVRIDEQGAVAGCHRLVDREAVFAGASSGAVAQSLIRHADDLPSGEVCVLICPDGGAGYLDTVYDPAWVDANVGTPAA